MKKYNVLFLFSDQHNAKCMSHLGHPQVKTPHLDSLAKQGYTFTNAYCNNPICTPSRMSFLSSLYPSTHGYYGLYGNPPQEKITHMFSYFADKGYRTGALGKLHTPRYWIEPHCQFIYDEFIQYPQYLDGAGLYQSNDQRAFTGNKDTQTSSIPYEHSCEYVLAKQTCHFLHNEGEPKDRGDDNAPWFAWVSFARPHQPYTPSEPFASMYPKDSLYLPPYDSNAKENLRQNSNLTQGDIKDYVSAYYGLVSQVDASIGLILEELKAMNQLDHTIIVYSADHGDYAGEHHLIEKLGGISSKAITNIPFIIRLPEQTQGQTIHQVIESVDLFPTLCELCNLTVPNTCQGESLLPLLQGKDTFDKESALTENPYRKALATSRYRYVSNLIEETDELYDLEEDPYELNNLIDTPEYKEQAYVLQNLLLKRLSQARKPYNTINGGWHDHSYDLDGRINLHECGPVNYYW